MNEATSDSVPTSKLKASRDLFACASSLRGDMGAYSWVEADV